MNRLSRLIRTEQFLYGCGIWQTICSLSTNYRRNAAPLTFN
ncbi:MAG: hypothetical protein SFY66_16525 [Oculatellaceae cyanobacterium bins.114]|nr:hypothetical protein [Oculatellaceae cyanobacterium bins.114]